MENTKFLRKYVTLLRLEKPRNSFPFYCYLIIYFLIVTGVCEAIITEQDSDKAVMAMGMITGEILLMFINIVNSVSPKNVMELISLIEEDVFVSRNDFVGRENYGEKIEQLNKQTERSMNITHQGIKLVLNIIFWGSIFENVTVYLLGIPIYSDNQSEPWLTPLLWRFKDDISPVAFFVYVFVFHSIAMALLTLAGYVVITVSCLSTERVLGDIQIFYQLLESFRRDFSENMSKNVEENDSTLRSRMRRYLKADMDRIVRCHQRVTRNFKISADNSALMISSLLLAVMAYSCSYAYFMLKTNEVQKAVTFAIMYLLINLALFLIYRNGQRIFDQSEKVRKSLAELPWTDKPRWLRQTVLIMLTRANVNLEMRPFGIYGLNYMSFKDMIKFIFSVGNVLYSRKLATQ